MTEAHFAHRKIQYNKNNNNNIINNHNNNNIYGVKWRFFQIVSKLCVVVQATARDGREEASSAITYRALSYGKFTGISGIHSVVFMPFSDTTDITHTLAIPVARGFPAVYPAGYIIFI